MSDSISEAILARGEELKAHLRLLRFRDPVSHVYNPLEYAWAPYKVYVSRYAAERKRVVFLGMNPGPFGMVQTGVPFGEVASVRDWLGINAPVLQPPSAHPKRPVIGFDCPRSEISGKRLWGLFSVTFGKAAAFFREHVVLNYCPLAFMESTGRNRTPDKLPPTEREPLFAACDEHLRRIVDVLEPRWVIGVGGFAFDRANEALQERNLKLGQILHPSPACPASNRDWAGTVTAQLKELGVW